MKHDDDTSYALQIHMVLAECLCRLETIQDKMGQPLAPELQEFLKTAKRLCQADLKDEAGMVQADMPDEPQSLEQGVQDVRQELCLQIPALHALVIGMEQAFEALGESDLSTELAGVTIH